MIKRRPQNNLNKKDNITRKSVDDYERMKLKTLRSALIEGEKSDDIENFCMDKIKTELDNTK